ncbi:MAG: hypothetical protein RBQ91_02265 [Acholeplasma sp.]|nr:hypothetical protein [Acholeplasma sp.]
MPTFEFKVIRTTYEEVEAESLEAAQLLIEEQHGLEDAEIEFLQVVPELKDITPEDEERFNKFFENIEESMSDYEDLYND